MIDSEVSKMRDNAISRFSKLSKELILKRCNQLIATVKKGGFDIDNRFPDTAKAILNFQ